MLVGSKHGMLFMINFSTRQLQGVFQLHDQSIKCFKVLCTWPDGKYYAREYLEDKKHGYGIVCWNDGRRYDGFWVNGLQ